MLPLRIRPRPASNQSTIIIALAPVGRCPPSILSSVVRITDPLSFMLIFLSISLSLPDSLTLSFPFPLFVSDHLGYPDYNAILSRPVRPFLNEYERRMVSLKRRTVGAVCPLPYRSETSCDYCAQ